MNKKDQIALKRYQEKLKLVRSSGGAIDPNETKADKKARIERAKKCFKFCTETYFPHYATSGTPEFLIKSAEDTLKNPKEKKFDQFGRGLAKSVLDNILKPFWLWINGQLNYQVTVTTSFDRASELLEDLRAEFEGNERIINDFGVQHNPGQWEKGFFITKGGFIGKALGAGQSVRGLRVKAQRPDYIVVDDLETRDTIANPKRQKKLAKWIERDLIPTMDGEIRRFQYANNKFAPIMIQTILQGLHPKWKVHHVKAYDPSTYKPTWHQKYSDTYYKEIESEIGTLAALAEYNNEAHIEGEIFKEEHIQWRDLPKLNHFKIIIGHWDVAFAGSATSDFNAVKVWGLHTTDFYQIDCFVKRTKMRAPIEWMCHFQKMLPDTVIVHWRFEAQFWNDEIERTIAEVEDEFGITLNIIKVNIEKVKKYDRMLTMHPYYQNGRIYYNSKKKSHNDTQVGISQLFGLEPGYKTNDDSPDADQQCISELSKYIPKSRGASKPKTARYKRPQRF